MLSCAKDAQTVTIVPGAVALVESPINLTRWSGAPHHLQVLVRGYPMTAGTPLLCKSRCSLEITATVRDRANNITESAEGSVRIQVWCRSG